MSPAVLQYILLALQALPSLVQAGVGLEAEVASLMAQIKLFVSENRDPTPAEWAAQNAALISALQKLQAAKPGG